MNELSKIPFSQNYPTTFNEVHSLDKKGRLYLPSYLLNFIMPNTDLISLGLYEVYKTDEQYLVGFITKNENEDIPKIFTNIGKNITNDDYPLISSHKIDSNNRVFLKRRLEDFFRTSIKEIRLKGMETHFIIESRS